MSLKVIGAGVGRTGTYSLKLALDRLGFGPTYHMDEVVQDLSARVPPWVAALEGRPDWNAIYTGYKSAVDWPTAGFYGELAAAFPSARFVLTTRTPESWARSFSETIYKILSQRHQAPPAMHGWLEMGAAVTARSGFPSGLDLSGLMKGFIAHQRAVEATIPAERLLVYEVKDGWGPLCAFLGVPVVDEPFPRTNDLSGFWERFSGAK